MSNFMLFNCGSTVMTAVLYILGTYIAISTAAFFGLSVAAGFLTMIGFAYWHNR